jgi:hypothetical protein
MRTNPWISLIEPLCCCKVHANDGTVCCCCVFCFVGLVWVGWCLLRSRLLRFDDRSASHCLDASVPTYGYLVQ